MNNFNMMWDTTVPLLAVLFWPVTATFGVIASWNFAPSTLLVLNGYCTFLWLRRHVDKAFAAWVGGLMMVVGPFAFTRAHAHLNLLAFFPVPLMALEVEKPFAGKLLHARTATAIGARIGLLAAIQVLCDIYRPYCAFGDRASTSSGRS